MTDPRKHKKLYEERDHIQKESAQFLLR